MKYFTPNKDQFVDGLDEEMFDTPKAEQSISSSLLLKASAKQLSDALVELDNAKAAVSVCKNRILGELPQECGDYEVELPPVGDKAATLLVKIPEKWEWDKDMLNEIVGTNIVAPPYVKNSQTVDRKALEQCPADEQRKVKRALTIKMGTPTFKVS